ncbi:hypothetical protein FJ976_01630 [Mesorhizobium sp. B1-1-9]|uniref:hypothetical protein n=1 Tax=Mesorhizobium sp. B1-1-9 TaxID=2589975 RepID=UPI00112B2520|nr:hypothetical protein [Mesorhizobium sp. B1-1-9]TPN58636.1 hypothetical protein FJ976_01630 [Mesorhizobium sp. B1-1-9]
MYELKEVGPAFLDEVAEYPGLIAVMVYAPSSRIFERKLRDAYHGLHWQSGGQLLVVAGQSDWVAPSDRRKMATDLRRTMRRPDALEMMVAFKPAGEYERAGRLIKLKERFGLKSDELPCLVFLSDPKGTDGYVCPIDRTTIQENSDALTDELGKIFEICGQYVTKDPCLRTKDGRVDEADVIAWRRKVMLQVEPTLKRRSLLVGMRRLAPSAANTLLGLAGLAS